MSLLQLTGRSFSRIRLSVKGSSLRFRGVPAFLGRRSGRTKAFSSSAVVFRRSLPQSWGLSSLKPSSSNLSVERRCFADDASRQVDEEEYDSDDDEFEDEELDEREWHLVYEGAMSGPLKRIKMVSITTCTLSMLTMPLLALYGNQDVALAGRVAVAFTAGIFGMGTTAFVHFIGQTYVSELWKKLEYEEGEDIEDLDPDEITTHLRAESFSLFGTKKVVEFNLDDVQQGDSRPFCSFKAHGNNYFLHHEPEAWIDGEEGLIEELFTRPVDSVDDSGAGGK